MPRTGAMTVKPENGTVTFLGPNSATQVQIHFRGGWPGLAGLLVPAARPKSLALWKGAAGVWQLSFRFPVICKGT